MTLPAGASLGPYQIVAPIGAGGMGEVYRARDPRLGREVAVKVLPASVAGDAERLRRFELEARATGTLNHPNILAVYDVGSHDGAPYVVSELLEGETLRKRMGGAALPLRKTLDYAKQIAEGLAAAHEKGVVHRDLKPENLFVTKDGRVKILDFGLAKLSRPEPSGEAHTDALTWSVVTDPGTVPGRILGTVGYMSPEQVRGLPADHRSDVFSFGIILYEMLSGRPAFKRDTAAETMTAILKEDPLEGSVPERAFAPGIERILRHCLEKSPEERFQSARDLAFNLEALSGASDSVAAPAVAPALRRRSLAPAGAALALLAATALGVFSGKTLWERPPLSFRQLTLRGGAITSARFAPDGQTVVYGASWEGGRLELYSTRPESPESRPLGIERAHVLSISRSGEMAILLLPEGEADRGAWGSMAFTTAGGTLARVPLGGGVPREVLEDTLDADWAPDGTDLALSRWAEGKCRLELPAGKVLYESDNAIVALRVSPHGDRVAFLESVSVTGSLANSSVLAVVDRAGGRRALASAWLPGGFAWSPSGEEIWFQALDEGGATALHAVTLAGKQRLIARFGGFAGLFDVFRDGRALISDDNGRNSIFALAPGMDTERNLTWHDSSTVADLSSDGRTLLFNETSLAGGPNFGVYLRRTDGSPAVRLGDGYGYALSPDGRWALSFTARGPRLEFVLWATRAGEPKRIASDLPAAFHGASWFPDNQRFLFSGSLPGEGARLYVQHIEGGKPQPLTEASADLRAPVISPDGAQAAAVDSEGQVLLSPLPGGEPRALRGTEEGEIPIQWSADGRSLFVYRPDHLPVRVFELEVGSGRRKLWKEIVLPDATGLQGNVAVVMAPDARSYAYSFFRGFSELYVVEGLR